MGPYAFGRLVQILRGTGRLTDNAYSCVEEQAVKSLYILAQNERNQSIGFFFHWSTEITSRHFHKAIISLEDKFFIKPDGTQVPPEIRYNNRFFPYFKDCLGVIDGTHFRVKVPKNEVSMYRRRKDFSSQNILDACTFYLKFTYVLHGWKGSAVDSRILDNATSREDKLKAHQ
ncbi:LOW QUALITY PROTEIN: hypothetical protein RJ640_029889, partial [Escallonia rubra]